MPPLSYAKNTAPRLLRPRPIRLPHAVRARRVSPPLLMRLRSEIVHIQGGQCGNQIGAKFW
eukprot:356874-Chlamydomonas_euryale.AAC.4